jgi:hypothetical protein
MKLTGMSSLFFDRIFNPEPFMALIGPTAVRATPWTLLSPDIPGPDESTSKAGTVKNKILWRSLPIR